MKKFDIGFISARIFLAIYGDKINSIHNGDDLLNNIKKISNIHEFIKVENIDIKDHINKKSSSNIKEYYNKCVSIFEYIYYIFYIHHLMCA